MHRLQFDGAWEGDCLPGGQFVASFPDGRLVTHLGTWMAAEWLRYPRMSQITNFVAGTGQTSNRIIELGPHMVSDKGPACGNSACAYWPDGLLEMNPDCTAPYFGLGIRWIDTVVHTGADTYIDHDRQIYEWTQHGEITAGQGGSGPYGEDPCVILFSGRRYLLEGGTCRVVRFARDGDRLAIGFFAMDKAAFVAHWLTVSEILALKDITDEEPPPLPVCDNYIDRGDGLCANCGHTKAEHAEDPEEPVALPNDVDVVRAVNAAHPELLRQNTAETVREFYWRATNALHAADPKWGMLTKTQGENHQVIGGERVAIDASAYIGSDEVVDFLIRAGDGPDSPSDVVWQIKPRRPENLWLKPVPFEEEPPPPDDDLEERVQALERESALQQARILNLEERVSALEQAPPGDGMTPAQVLAMIDAAFANASITGRTQSAGGILSHSHGVSGLAIRRNP